jgi:hypothetical protein
MQASIAAVTLLVSSALTSVAFDNKGENRGMSLFVSQRAVAKKISWKATALLLFIMDHTYAFV